MNKRTILIVDDDEELCSELEEQFSIYEEFQTLHERTAGKGIQAVRRGIVDLVIMDVGLPDMDGREAVKILRRSDYKAPIIMLTALATDSDIILGLEAGANDYVTLQCFLPASARNCVSSSIPMMRLSRSDRTLSSQARSF